METANLTDAQLADFGYDRLDDLARLRAHAARYGGDVYVRSVVTDSGQAGYVYGVAIPGDLPFWRGSLEAAADKVAELQTR
jgi:hypothetical protein